MRPLERSAFDVLDESEEEVYHAKQPSTKSSVEREGASACTHADLDSPDGPSRSERLRLNRRGRSRLRLGLSEDRFAKLVGRAERELLEADDSCETASSARDLTLENAASMLFLASLCVSELIRASGRVGG